MTETLIYKVKRPQRLPITKESCRRLLKYKSNDVNLNTLSCTADCDLENVHLQHARKVMTDMTHDFEATSSSVQRFQRTYSMSLYQSAAAQAPDIVKWLEQNFEEGLNVSVQRCEVYAEYLDFCATCCVDPINAASLGKMLRMVFPGVRTRRLGTRGQSKYHYYGIKIKKKSVSQTPLLSHMSEGCLTEEGSQNSKMSTTGTPGSLISSFSSWDIPGCELFESLDLPGLEGSESDSLSLSADHPVGMRSTEGGGLAAKGGLKPERNSPCQRDSGLPEFPGTERLRVPLHLKEKTTVFLLLYRHHCQRVLDSVVRANFAEVENLLKSFWRSLPLRLQPLLLSPFTVDLILLYDLTLYRMLASTLFPTLCQEMSASLKSELRRFAVDLQRWFEDALRRQPLLLRNKILEGAGFFCRWLKHQTEVCHIVSSASFILQNAAHVSQLRDDWLRLDLPHIARHGRWVLMGEDLRRSGQTEEERLIQRYMVDFGKLISGGMSMVKFLDWIYEVFCVAVIVKVGETDIVKQVESESTFLLHCNFVLGVINKELYLAQAFSYGSYHLLSLLFLDVVRHLAAEFQLERKRKELRNRLYFGSGRDEVSGSQVKVTAEPPKETKVEITSSCHEFFTPDSPCLQGRD